MITALPAYILAGGESRRFGSDKARALLWGEPLILHVVQAIAPLTRSVAVVASAPGAYGDLGLRTLGDEEPRRGPLGGLVRALEDLDDGWLLLAPCDVIGLRPEWIATLWQARTETSRAVAFRDERWQTLPALYHRLTLPAARAALAAGERALWRVIEGLEAVALPLPDDWAEASAISTREDLEALVRRSRLVPDVSLE